MIDLSLLGGALQDLDARLFEAGLCPPSQGIRHAVIQRFESCHELALGFIRCALESSFGDPVDQLTYNQTLRLAAERGLIDDLQA